MHKFSKDTFIDFDKYERHLRYLSHIYLDYNGLVGALNQAMQLNNTYQQQATRYMEVMSGRTLSFISRTDCLIEFLTDFEGCPKRRFMTKKNQSGVSVNRKNVLEPLRNDGYAPEFLDLYFEYSTYKKMCSSISLLLSKHSFTATDVCGNNNEQLQQCNFNVSQQQNFRYNYSGHDIITIPKPCNNCVTVPKGKLLAWGDFSQADLRSAYNIFIRDDENIEIVKQYSDMYEAIARIVADANNEDFNSEEFKEKRNIMKAVILSCVYGKRGDIEKSKAEFLKEFGEYLDNKCPRYMEYRRRIRNYTKTKNDIYLDTYFGQSLRVNNDFSYSYEPMSLENKCLNYPIQSCTSLIVIMTVNAILDRFYELGYTEDQIGVYYTRHDEPVFILDEEVMKDSWVFEDFKKIFIDDWYPMELSFEFGYNYTIPNPGLLEKYNESVENNRHKIHHEEMDKPSGKMFLPLKETYDIHLGVAKTFDEQIVYAFYDPAKNVCAYRKVPEFDYRYIEQFICDWDREDLEYSLIRVCNRGLDKNTVYRRVHYSYTTDITELRFSDALASYMALKYAKREGQDVTLTAQCAEFIDRIKGVKTVDNLFE